MYNSFGLDKCTGESWYVYRSNSNFRSTALLNMIVAAATYVYFSAQSIYALSLLRSVAIMRTRTGHSGPADTDLAPCHRTVDAILSRHGTFQTPLLVGRGSLGDKVPRHPTGLEVARRRRADRRPASAFCCRLHAVSTRTRKPSLRGRECFGH